MTALSNSDRSVSESVSLLSQKREGADQIRSSSDMRLPLVILAASSLVFWVSIWDIILGVNIVLDTVRKFACYLSSVAWINSAFYIREVAAETEVDSWEFQKEQVKLTLCFIVVIILSELPVWIDALSLP